MFISLLLDSQLGAVLWFELQFLVCVIACLGASTTRSASRLCLPRRRWTAYSCKEALSWALREAAQTSSSIEKSSH